MLDDGPSSVLSLRQSRRKVSGADLGQCRFSAVLQGFGRPELELWAPEGEYRFALIQGDAVVTQGMARSENGVLSIDTDITSFDPVTITVRCAELEP